MSVGLATIALIVVLGRTRLGALGLVVAVIATSAAVSIGGWEQVATLNDLGVTIGSLPSFELPRLRSIPTLILPAVSLAFVGLVQGAGISATFPNPDGTYPDSSRDFVGQGAANIASGVLQGMPVGGSVSASALNKEAGAQTRASLLVAAVVMAIVIVAFIVAFGDIAMPARAGLLILIGIRTVKPADLATVWHVGIVQRVVLVVTFTLTMLPDVGPDTTGSVVILRLRGRTDLGTTFMDVLHRYATALAASDSKLVLSSVSDRVLEQLGVAGVTEVIPADDLYLGDERIGATLRRTHDDALAWVASRQ